jgi:hypothetical protein
MGQVIPVKGLGEVGLVTDLPFSELPLNAWTDVRNVRFRKGAVEKILGHVEALPGMLYPSEFLFQSAMHGTAYWMYASPTQVGATDGANHVSITRASAPYTMHPTYGWTGTSVEDIPVLNNGFDVPQVWDRPALGTPLVDLPNWPVGYSAGTICALKRYLVALNVTKSGVNYPTMIKWSHEAPTGLLPTSWDEEDETNDAGEWTLPGEGGPLVDGSPLRDVLMLYKEFQTWQMQYVGGDFIFRFSRLFGHVGALSRRCALEFFSGRHLVFTGSDVVVHDGNTVDSIIEDRMKSFITNNLDEVNYFKSFIAIDVDNKEAWICWPGRGQSRCTFAAIWNWARNTWGIRELPAVSHAAQGLVVPIDASETWAGAVGTWETDTAAWGDRSSDPTKRRLLMAAPDVSKLYTANSTQKFADNNMVAYAERQCLGFPIKSGQPPDYHRMKQIDKLYPKITGTAGGVVKVSLGVQASENSPPTYMQAQAFVIGKTQFLDFGGSEASRLHALKFESDSDIQWKMNSYDVEVTDRGNA